MESKSKMGGRLEVYKCIVLTIIAVILIGIFLRTPVPFTIKNLQLKFGGKNYEENSVFFETYD